MNAVFAGPSRFGSSASYVSLILIWGSLFLFTSWAADTVTPLQVSLLRVGFGLIPVALFALFTRSFRLAHLRYLPHFFVMSVLSNSFYYWTLSSGVFRLDSGVAGAFTGSIPIFTFLASLVFLRSESGSWLKLVGVLLGAAGVALLARPWDAGAIDPIGVMFMLLCASSYGLSFAYARRFIAPLGIPAAAGASYQMVLAFLTLLVVTPLDGIDAIFGDPRALWGVVLGLGLFGTGISTVLYYMLVRGVGAVTAATTTYFTPFTALTIGVLIAGESFHITVLPAVILLLAAAIMTRTAPRRPNIPPPAAV
ncbi:DMT family transporter [Leucobacter sp. GX24907]